jgi:hypothetical protein
MDLGFDAMHYTLKAWEAVADSVFLVYKIWVGLLLPQILYCVICARLYQPDNCILSTLALAINLTLVLTAAMAIILVNDYFLPISNTYRCFIWLLCTGIWVCIFECWRREIQDMRRSWHQQWLLGQQFSRPFKNIRDWDEIIKQKLADEGTRTEWVKVEELGVEMEGMEELLFIYL